MNVEVVVLVGSFLTGISGMIVALYTAFSSASRGELEAVVKENTRLRNIIEKQESKIDRLERELDELREENGSLKKWAEKLVRQVYQLGAEPVKPGD